MNRLLRIAVDLVFIALFVNALMIIVGWFIFPPVVGYHNAWGANWLIVLTAVALRVFVLLLPLTALVILLGLVVDTGRGEIGENPAATQSDTTT